MYKRIIILSVIILAALFGLTWLGYHSIQIRAKGMEGARLGEFAEVAEQIKQDVKRKLDEFIRTEQNRPYTDYQYYYVPENVADAQQEMPLLRSPLGDSIYNSLAYGNFQVEPDGEIITPYYKDEHGNQKSELSKQADAHIKNIRLNLLPALNVSAGGFRLPSGDLYVARRSQRMPDSSLDQRGKKETDKQVVAETKGSRARAYRIQSLEQHPQKEQIVTQKRRVVAENVMRGIGRAGQEVDSMMPPETLQQQKSYLPDEVMQIADRQLSEQSRLGITQEIPTGRLEGSQTEQLQVAKVNELAEREDIVKIRIEPFVPLVVNGPDPEQFTFGGQVFMLRHIQIENRHLLQGFQLNEKELVEEVKDSARRFMREGMDYELSRTQNADAAFAAILDFGFGNLVLNLIETDPAWIGRQTGKLRNWYFSIIGIVLLAVLLGLLSLWRNARAQIKLAQKKDNFISAVSHELRTPLTSIRMYSEMLEKNWIKSKEKTAEYYTYMRQESERLSRLIENILDFSRIQKGRKTYTFNLGDINQCIADVVEMMRPYASQGGFLIKTDFKEFEQITFDKDAVAQIIVNLLDNAVKYARDAEDKTIIVRTRRSQNFVLIEVEDHGPGIPHSQRKKVFEEFYRVGSEATRETNGTGLGLALVKKFAEAHKGFVEIINAKPMGAVFRIGLIVQS